MRLKEAIEQWTHDEVLEAAADALDIPPSLYEEAKVRYRSIGNWLDRENSSLTGYDPRISPQGSFLLGTVIRPLTEADEYDIDLVCRLEATKQAFSQKELKDAVGTELKLYVKANNMNNPLEEGRRCWILNYANSARFHMDVLPALPDAATYRRKLIEAGSWPGTIGDLVDSALAITDNTLPKYETRTDDWPVSNPFGYAEWFRSRMAGQLDRLLTERQRLTASVDPIPHDQVKTPLQRAVQLLKRHRDSMFADAPEDKPISIIITTLAARAYQNEHSLSAALRTLLTNMDKFIENRNGVTWVVNPANPMENFADKWKEAPQRQKNFNAWLEQANRDFGAYISGSAARSVPDILRKRLGESLVSSLLGVAAPAVRTNTGSNLARAHAEVKVINEQGGAKSKPWAMRNDARKG